MNDQSKNGIDQIETIKKANLCNKVHRETIPKKSMRACLCLYRKGHVCQQPLNCYTSISKQITTSSQNIMLIHALKETRKEHFSYVAM